MSYYHIIIQQEQRKPRETPLGTDTSRLAIPISVPVEQGEDWTSGPVQLHTLSAAGLPENIDAPQFVGVFEWDGSAPYIIAHKGDYAARTMGYAGWPDLTKEQFDAANPVAL